MVRGTEAAVVVALLIASPASADDPTAGSPSLSVRVDWPGIDPTVPSERGHAFIAGRAGALRAAALDLAILVDISDSTAAPSGLDVDDDGTAQGRAPLSPARILDKFLRIPEDENDDSVLAAELRAVRTLVSRVGCPETRLVLIAFSGDADPLTPDASVVAPLTVDKNEIDAGLEQILLTGPNGLTNFAAALEAAQDSLLGAERAASDATRRHVLLLSDGLPTLPYLGNAKGNSQKAIARASKLAKAGIRIDTVAIGREATDDPKVLREVARIGGGVFTSAREAASLSEVFEALELSGVEDLSIRNATTGRTASSLRRFADGCFGALVPVTEGVNEIELVARGALGEDVRADIALRVGDERGSLPQHLVGLRDALMAEGAPPAPPVAAQPAQERTP